MTLPLRVSAQLQLLTDDESVQLVQVAVVPVSVQEIEPLVAVDVAVSVTDEPAL